MESSKILISSFLSQTYASLAILFLFLLFVYLFLIELLELVSFLWESLITTLPLIDYLLHNCAPFQVFLLISTSFLLSLSLLQKQFMVLLLLGSFVKIMTQSDLKFQKVTYHIKKLNYEC